MDSRLRSACLSLDLDNKWAYLKTNGDTSWQTYPSFLTTAVPRITQFLNESKLKPTIFIVGRDLDLPGGRDSIENFSRLGCELGNHTENHRADFHALGSTEMEAEIETCEEKIRLLIGNKPIGFRGPSFQISDNIANILVNRGYKYDASSYPNSVGPLARAYHFMNSNLSREEKERQSHLFGGFRDALSTLHPHEWQVDSGIITEVPVTTMPIFRLPIHFTYLNYLADKSASLAEFYIRISLNLLKMTNTQPSLLLHATDFLGAGDKEIPKFLPGMQRSYKEKLRFLKRVMSRYQTHYQFSGIADTFG